MNLCEENTFYPKHNYLAEKIMTILQKYGFNKGSESQNGWGCEGPLVQPSYWSKATYSPGCYQQLKFYSLV